MVENEREAPSISVVYLTASGYRPLAAVMGRLTLQTIASKTEVLIVAPDASRVAVPAAHAAPFHGLRVLSEPRRDIGAARARAVRAAAAPFVAFGEDHCYPDPQWLEVLLARHREGYAVVGPGLRNENPQTCRSWVSFLLAYGTWAHPADAAEAKNVAGHQCSYRRSAMLDFNGKLDVWLHAETILHWKLAERGERLLVEPRAVVSHYNLSSARRLFPARFHGSRVFSAVWSQDWTWARRLRFAVLSPAIALRRLGAIHAAIRRQPPGFAPLWQLLPLVWMSLLVAGLGYMWGFVFGFGGSLAKVYQEELDRPQCLSREDALRLNRERDEALQDAAVSCVPS